jgi:hypothetical protein
MALPKCGFYKTTREFNQIPGGTLVYFHNHGEPGPGIYLPQNWVSNRVQWNSNGHTIPNDEFASTLMPVEPEGLFSVKNNFYCCEKKCVHFHTGQLVQIGYDGQANAILFVPELSATGLHFPEQGTRVDVESFAHLNRVTVAQGKQPVQSAFLH